MIFYQIRAFLRTPIKPEEKESYKDEINLLTTTHNSKFPSIPIVVIVRLNTKTVFAVSALPDDYDGDEAIDYTTFLESVNLKYSGMEIEEITFTFFMSALESASKQGFLEEKSDVFDILSLSINSDSMEEKICKGIKSEEEAKATAKELTCFPEFALEVERICEKTSKKFLAHPVQYIIMGDDEKSVDKLIDTLVSVLYFKNRLNSLRIGFYLQKDDARYRISRDIDIDELYSIQRESTVVVSLNDNAREGIDVVRNSDSEFIEELSNEILKNHRTTLSIIKMPRKAESILTELTKSLQGIRFVVLKENLMDKEQSIAFLKTLAADAGFLSEAPSLIEELGVEEKCYYPEDLHSIFDEWFSEYLIEQRFPQYKNSLKCKKELSVRPKGSAYEELMSMIGLDKAKKTLNEILSYYKLQETYKKIGAKANITSRHMVFTGNPGTAKTTCARLFSAIMKDNKLLESGVFIEAGRADICDRYVGGTAPRVRDLFKKAQGGVLFIDEAYSLVDYKKGLYGDEAINTIVQEMENRRDSVIVIFAGYPEEMEVFLERNPGLNSRIAFHINFDDYTETELYEILKLFTAKNNFILDGDVMEQVLPIFKKAICNRDFGNGRFVRNLFEKALMKQASRLVEQDYMNLDKNTLSTLKAIDFESPGDFKKDEIIRSIGFIG